MTEIYFIIVAFLLMLAVFDLFVGVSNDAVNFLNSAVGAKVAKYRTILIVASLGVVIGAIMSSGMMDVARHGIMRPENYSFHEVMTIFLAVMVTDVIILDIFNTLGMPTSTTVSLVFELLGGTFILAMLKMSADPTLAISDLLNSDKALSVIIAIFVSVAIAFFFGALVQWISRIIFTFNYRHHLRWSIAIFGGIAFTTLSYFILIKGLGKSPYISAATREWIDVNTAMLMTCTFVVSTVVIEVLHLLHVRIFRLIVLLGTFALAMAFAGNDLVNFIGVPLAGLDSLCDFTANGNGNYDGYMMTSLMTSAKSPLLYLLLAGLIMIIAMATSKKAQNVVKTSVDLSRQDEGDEMFGSSRLARSIVRSSRDIGELVVRFTPKSVSRWIDSRFNKDEVILAEGAAFDEVRAAVNLVLAALLIVLGTSLKLPLSTTYVTFMVAMGTSLADRAWSRESAVFRITGVLSVIGGWFITAGAAFIVCYLVTNGMYFGSFVAMALAILLAIYLLVKNNVRFNAGQKTSETDALFAQLLRETDKTKRWGLLKAHVGCGNAEQLRSAAHCYKTITDAFLHEEYRPLRHATHEIETARKQLKRQRRREIIGLRKIDPVLAVEKNTWYFMANGAIEQIIYGLKRINDPCREHVGNSFRPVSGEYAYDFQRIQKQVADLFAQTEQLVQTEVTDEAAVTAVRQRAEAVQRQLSDYRKQVIDSMQKNTVNIESTTVFLNMVQESQQMLSCLRHLLRGMARFCQ